MKNRVLPFLGIVSVSAVVLSTFPATLASAQTSYGSVKLSQVYNRVTAAKKSQEAKIAQLADALKSTTKVYNQVNQQSNATIQTAQGWSNRKQGIVNDAQQKSNAANTWLTQKQAELAKEQAKQQPIIDAANATIQTAQGWINRKQGIVNDAQQKSNAANTWLAEKQAELKKEQAKQQPIIDTANATIQTAQGWINRKQGIVDDAQQKSNAANTWLAEKQAELKNEQTKQQAIINAANAEIITRNSFVNRKQDAYNAAQKAHAAAITDEEKAATETQLQKAYQDLRKEKGIRDAAVLSQNKIISTAQGWINRKQAIVNDAQSKANATNTWLAEKQAELKKEQAKQQPIIDAANATIQTAQGWINRKQGIVNDAQQKSNAANTWLAEKQAELKKEQAKQQPIIDTANATIQTAQGWINRKQGIVDDAQQKSNAANTWLTQKQAELKKEKDKQQPIIDKAKKDIEVAAANVALANKAYKAALSWMEGFNQGVQDFKSGYAFRPGTAFGQDYITGYKTGYDLASQCANNETNINNQSSSIVNSVTNNSSPQPSTNTVNMPQTTENNINNQPSSIVNSVTNNSSPQPSTNTVNMPQTTENKKEALVHNTLPQTGDAINITSVLAGVVAILGSLFGLSSMRGRGNNK